MSSPQNTDSSLPNDQPGGDEPTAPTTVSAADFEKLQGNYHAAQRQIKKLKESQVNPDDLVQDTDFVKKVFDAYSVPYDDDGKYAIPESYRDQAQMEEEFKKRLTDARTKWESKELKPFQEKLGSYEEQLENARKTNLRNMLEQSARRSGILENKFKPLPFGKAKNYAPVHAAEAEFRYSGEVGDWILYDGDDPVYTQTGDAVRPDQYWDYFKSQVDDQTKQDWFGNPAQRGSGYLSNGMQKGPYTLTREQARDTTTYRRAKAAAEKAGQELQILD